MRSSNHPFFAPVFACLVMLIAAVAGGPAAAGEGEGLPGSHWRPTEIYDMELPVVAGMEVHFGGEGELRGNGGCNGFFGSYELEGDKIEIGPLGGTQMACPPPVMERESLLMEVLAKVKRYERDGTELSLIDENGTPIVRFTELGGH